MKEKSKNFGLSLPAEIVAGGLIWLELHTGNTLIIELIVAICMVGGIFYSLYVAVINQLFKNNQSWRFKYHG